MMAVQHLSVQWMLAKIKTNSKRSGDRSQQASEHLPYLPHDAAFIPLCRRPVAQRDHELLR